MDMNVTHQVDAGKRSLIREFVDLKNDNLHDYAYTQIIQTCSGDIWDDVVINVVEIISVNLQWRTEER